MLGHKGQTIQSALPRAAFKQVVVTGVRFSVTLQFALYADAFRSVTVSSDCE